MKVGTCRQLIKLLSYVSIKGHGHFLTLDRGHLYMKTKTGFSQKQVSNFEPNFIRKVFGTRELKLNDMMLVT